VVMGLRHSIQQVGNQRCVVLSGLLGRCDEIDVLDDLLAREDFEPGMPWLVTNHKNQMIPSINEIHRLVSFFRVREREVGDARIALVTLSPAAYAMGRVLSARTDELSARITPFRDYHDATDWICRRTDRACSTH